MDRNAAADITPDEHSDLTNLIEWGQQLMLCKFEGAALLTRQSRKRYGGLKIGRKGINGNLNLSLESDPGAD